MTTPTNWIPFPLYNHLVLNDYLGHRLPEPMVAYPEDRTRLQWQKSIVNNVNDFFSLIPNVERPTGSGNDQKRWPYSSSYQFVAAFWSPDYDRFLPGGATLRTVHQGPTHATYYVPTATDKTVLGDRKLSDVLYPELKVAMYDQFDRHPTVSGSPQLYNCYEDATVPLLFFDTSVRDVRTNKTNRGFNPAAPLNQTGVTSFAYTPSGWEPARKANAPPGVIGHYRWTRAGLRGVDVQGTEVQVRNAVN